MPPKEDARVCATVVREIVEARGLKGDHRAIATITNTVARLYSNGIRGREALLMELRRLAEISQRHEAGSKPAGQPNSMPWDPS